MAAEKHLSLTPEKFPKEMMGGGFAKRQKAGMYKENFLRPSLAISRKALAASQGRKAGRFWPDKPAPSAPEAAADGFARRRLRLVRAIALTAPCCAPVGRRWQPSAAVARGREGLDVPELSSLSGKAEGGGRVSDGEAGGQPRGLFTAASV